MKIHFVFPHFYAARCLPGQPVTWPSCITWQILWSETQRVIRVKTKQFTKIMLIWPLLWEKNCFVAATKAFWNYKSIFNGPIEYACAYRRIYALFTCKHIRVHMYFNMLTRNDIDIVKVPSITPTLSMWMNISVSIWIMRSSCHVNKWQHSVY